MRGRKPHPTARRRLEGNPGRRPFNDAEPAPPPPSPAFDTPPAELTDHPIAIAEWQRLAPLLRASRVVTDVDRAALLALCLEWSRYLDAQTQIKSLGMIVKAPSGYPIVNPFLSIANKALTQCQKLWPELGLTPSSRSRVHVPGGAAAGDPFAEFDEPLPLKIVS